MQIAQGVAEAVLLEAMSVRGQVEEIIQSYVFANRNRRVACYWGSHPIVEKRGSSRNA